jgi:hypothetical protein
VPPTTPSISAELLTALLSGFFAILGVVVGLIGSQLLRNGGRIILSVSSYSLNKNKGEEEPDKSPAENESVDCSFELDFFNTSDVPKSLRSLSLEFIPKKSKKSTILKVNIRVKLEASDRAIFLSPYKELKIINLPPKEIVSFKIYGYPSREEIPLLQGKVDFFFKAEYPNGKTFRKKLITKEF